MTAKGGLFLHMKHGNTKIKISKKGLALWIGTVVVSLILIIAGHALVSKGLHIMDNTDMVAKAKVTELTGIVEEQLDEAQYNARTLHFKAEIISGKFKGQTVACNQQTDSYTMTSERFVKKGDRIIIFNYSMNDPEAEWVFGSYARFDTVAVLGIIFVALVIFFGGGKGVSTMVSLALTCLAVFCVFLPSVLSGINIYLMTVLTCAFTIVMTLLLTNGATPKSFTTMLGCGAGVLVAAILTVIFDRIMHLTGVIDEHSVYIQVMNEQGGSIDLRALIFAMITIGAMGAVMDVAMDIASSLYEVQRHAPDISFKEMFRSGMNIGRDVMGTMANTLVLAYIGSSLCSIILKVSYSNSLMHLLNTEGIVVELLQAIVGSLGILLTIPLTALICCVKYRAK